MSAKRWFTLYFLPVIPMGTAGQYVECQSCGGTYGVEILGMGPNASHATRRPSKQSDPTLIILAVVLGVIGLPLLAVFLLFVMFLFMVVSRDEPRNVANEPGAARRVDERDRLDPARFNGQPFNADPATDWHPAGNPARFDPPSPITQSIPSPEVRPQPAPAQPPRPVNPLRLPVPVVPPQPPRRDPVADEPMVEAIELAVTAENDEGQIQQYALTGSTLELLAFSPDGRYLVGINDRQASIYDLVTAKELLGHGLTLLGSSTQVVFSPDGKWLLEYGQPGRIQTWRFDDGRVTRGRTYVGHRDDVTGISVSPENKFVLSGDARGWVHCWNLETGQQRFMLAGFAAPVKVTFVAPGEQLAMASDGLQIRMIDVAQGNFSRSNRLPGPGRSDLVTISPDGMRMMLGTRNLLIPLDLNFGGPGVPLRAKEPQTGGQFSPEGKYFASGGSGKVNLWNVTRYELAHTIKTESTSRVKALAYSPDGQHLAAATSTPGKPLQIFRLPAHIK